MSERKVFLTELYNEFQCLGGSCPQTCCRGWLIPVDPETKRNYLLEKGFPGILLPFSLSGGGEKPTVIRKVCGRCPFHTTEGLCRHQLMDRLDLMPLTCRLYPRTSLLFEDHQEVTFELSCLEAARIFLRHPGRLTLTESDCMVEVGWEAASPSPDFVSFLVQKRERLLDFLWDDSLSFSPMERQRAIYRHVRQLHLLIAQDRMEEASALPFDPSFTEDEEDALASRTLEHSFFPMTFINRMIYQPIDLTMIRYREPMIYKLLRKYRKLFGDLYESQADSFFDQKMNALLKTNPYLEKTFRSYFSYLIQQTLLTASEDYYLLRPLLLSLLQVQFFMLFCLISHETGETLDTEQMALILSGCEKALAHNPGLSDLFVAEIRKEFF